MGKRQGALIVLVILIALSVKAQYVSDSLYFGSIKQNIGYQLELFPQEKLHLHIDKKYYVSGEHIWFRAHLVNALSNCPDSLSRYVYVELINPLDSVVIRNKIQRQNSVYSGRISIPEDIPEGNYTIRAYTYFMKNLGEDYFYKKVIRIASPLAATMITETSFRYEDDNKKLKMNIAFKDATSKKKIEPKSVRIKIGKDDIRPVRIQKDSTVEFSIKLPSKSRINVIYLECDKYKQYIQIPSPEADFDVAFFPEGGDLLEGTPSIIAFKAIKTDGLSETIAGVVVDEIGDTITYIESSHLGMGAFSLHPQKGKKYMAICQNQRGIVKTFDLPSAHSDTYALKTGWSNDRLYISVLQSSDIKDVPPLYILVHTRGIVQCVVGWDGSKEYLLIDKTTLPAGVLHILLLDASKNVLSERLVFCTNKEQIEAKCVFGTDKTHYKAREKVNANIQVNDYKGNPLSGSFSVAITDDKNIDIDSTTSILSTLLLTSELRGYIESPDYYFQNKTKPAERQLDILMCTQGWRRYNMPRVLKGEFDYLTEPLELGSEISGKVKTLIRGKAIESSPVSMMSLNIGYVNTTVTGIDGKFAFKGIDFPDSTSFIIQALSKKGSKRVEILVDKDLYPPVKNHIITPLFEHDIEYKDYVSKAEEKYLLENGMRMIYLKEVEVSASKRDNRNSIYSFWADIDGRSFTADDIQSWNFPDIKSLLIQSHGIYISGDDVKVQVRGATNQGTPLLVIDGVFYDETDRVDGSNTNSLGMYLDMVNIKDVERVDIMRGIPSPVFGSKGSSGVIAITTKKGQFTANRDVQYNIKQITPLGYQKNVEFYSPKYETQEQIDNNTPDLRTTIYWIPDIQLYDGNPSSFDFYTSDAETTYSVVIEGVTNNGKIVRQVEKISRK